MKIRLATMEFNHVVIGCSARIDMARVERFADVFLLTNPRIDGPRRDTNHLCYSLAAAMAVQEIQKMHRHILNDSMLNLTRST